MSRSPIFFLKISDERIPEKLRRELPGILVWAVQGCREWQEQGLNVPTSISNATAAYRAEMDIKVTADTYGSGLENL